MNLLLLTKTTSGGFLPLIIFGLTILAFYFLVILPQKKKQKKMQETVDGLKIGDHIVTRAGLRGVIVQLKGDSFILETGPNAVKLEYLKYALAYIESREGDSDINNPYANQHIGDLSYGNDSRFIEKLNELKKQDNSNTDFDLLLEDIYEFIVKESTTDVEDLMKTFKLDKKRADKLLKQLEQLGALSSANSSGIRKVLIDPRA